jgi:hypothetical protein
MFCCPEQGNLPLLQTRCTQRDHMVPLNVLGLLIVSQLGLCQDHAADTHLAQPLGRHRQTCSPTAPDVPSSNGEGPATPWQRGRRQS